MSSGDGSHSLRRHPLRSPNKKAKKSDDKGSRTQNISVHTKNFYIASYPVVLLFNILRSVLYHVYLLLKTLFRAGDYLAHGRTTHEIPPNNITPHTTTTSVVITDLDSIGVVGSGGEAEQQVVVEEGRSGDIEFCGGVGGGDNNMPPPKSINNPPNPGPGDPLLARQKHHHRKAFEYISKALKIDEENEGRVLTML
ncbi:hypothetical protein Pmani_036205 [Petrolisthes manimaculis]|uniref:Uncharacterized protein n=1 Tax=Petrolisthes manimaculis TaxID=1843537 RepID=A0AAE1NIV4_9EUCA|nr:hypothetical protein Pmani_036205 [Petrolisthes manimaculis]